MDSADKLIEYYFQRKIAGMPSADIYQSLEKQMLEEEERKIILSQVEHKESLYLKALTHKKLAKIIAISSAALLTLTVVVFIYTSTSAVELINPIFIYIAFGLGTAAALSSFLLFPKKSFAKN